MKVRYIEAAGMHASLRAYWDEYVFDPSKKIYIGKNTCPNGYGHGKPGIHDASKRYVEQHSLPRDESLGGNVRDHAASAWPTSCDHCQAAVPDVAPAREFGDRQKDGWVLEHQVFRQTLYATPDRTWWGLPEVGDMFFADWYECEGRCVHGWTNCDGRSIAVTGWHGFLHNGDLHEGCTNACRR
jgi:hypothetical protein